jgi:hypothetical protein
LLFAFNACENPILAKLLKPLIEEQENSGNSEEEGDVPGDKVEEKLDWLNTHAVEGGNYIVTVSSSENIKAGNQLHYDGKKVTITMTGGGFLNLIDNGCMFSIGSNVTLILENITLISNNSNNSPLVVVNGVLTMEEGAKITGNKNNGDNGGGGGGVAVNPKGTFNMNGGEISSNTANMGGGVALRENSIFNMSGGKVFDNTSNGSGGGVAILGKGNFTMSGGEINGNKANNYGGGVYVGNDGTFIKKDGGTITGHASATETENGNMVTTDSTTSNNEQIVGNGHAVYVQGNPPKYRNSTAGPGDDMDSTKDGLNGGWGQ